MIAVIHLNIAVSHVTPRLEAPQLRLDDAAFKSFQEAYQGDTPAQATWW
jgi:hypothetical protein